MTQEGRPRKPRHRRRATAAAGPAPTPAAAPPPPPKAAPSKAAPRKAASPKAAPPKRRRETGSERGLRDVVGAGSSQVGVSRALRARDVNRPTTDDLAAAAAELQLVRRNWKPQS